MKTIEITHINSSITTIDKLNSFINEWYAHNEFITVKSSGSTGKPKEIKLKKEYLIASARMTGAFFNYRPHHTILLSLSIDTIGGKMIVIRALTHNMHLIVVEPNKNPLIDVDTQIKFISLVPYQLNHILTDTPNKLELVSIVLLGGAPVSYQLKQKIQTLNPDFFESFGMTETMSHIALKNLKNESTYFTTLEGINVSKNTNNQLIIKADQLGINELQTTDEINIISPTSFEWLGRTDFAINSGGFKFHPELIEIKLEPYIQEPFFIHKESDVSLGERIICCVEGKYDELVDNKLNYIFTHKLDRYEIPKKVYFIKSFTYTNSIKINRSLSYNSIFHA
jgi:O-succinylbenzoic acid--CoA ligase